MGHFLTGGPEHPSHKKLGVHRKEEMCILMSSLSCSNFLQAHSVCQSLCWVLYQETPRQRATYVPVLHTTSQPESVKQVPKATCGWEQGHNTASQSDSLPPHHGSPNKTLSSIRCGRKAPMRWENPTKALVRHSISLHRCRDPRSSGQVTNRQHPEEQGTLTKKVRKGLCPWSRPASHS